MSTASARSESLARAIEHAMPLFERFLGGFDDANRTAQAPSLPNHAAWTLGHLAHTASRGALIIAGTPDAPLPDDEFVVGDGSRGDARRFDTESVAFGSVPVNDPGRYPGWDRCVEVYRAAHQRLIDAARGAGDDGLDRAVSWGSARITAEMLGHRLAFHLGTHTGQLVDLRRALGLGPALV